MVNAELLASCKEGVYIINVARGELRSSTRCVACAKTNLLTVSSLAMHHCISLRRLHALFRQIFSSMGLAGSIKLFSCALSPAVSTASATLANAGGLLDYDAVLEGLNSGRIGGVGLDVQWVEPFNPDDPVAKHPRFAPFALEQCVLLPFLS